MRTKEELIAENTSLHRINEKMKGEVLILQEELRMQNTRRDDVARIPLREDRFEGLRREN